MVRTRPTPATSPGGQDRARYDVILVGTGFASSFFLHRFLANTRQATRVLVLERGDVRTHGWQLEHGRRALREASEATVFNQTPEKEWEFCVAFGGGSNCWSGATPRMLPEDFKLRSNFGVGSDWPIDYDTVAPYYDLAEELMAIAGPDHTPYPRSGPYPQPPHLMSEIDRAFAEAFPDAFVSAPCARPTLGTDSRAPCCANGVCGLCPIDSKFTVPNELGGTYQDPRVTLRLGAAVQAIETSAGLATAVLANENGRETRHYGDAVVLGANGIFNPHILLRSGLGGPLVGRGLCEQVSMNVILDLAGVPNFGGSTKVTGNGYMLHGPERRSDRAAALIETHNSPLYLREEPGRWRDVLRLRVVFEDLPQEGNRVQVDGGEPERPVLRFEQGRSAYALRALDSLASDLEPIVARLPVERYRVADRNGTESHIQCTTPMADAPADGVVDADSLLHDVRNVAVLGSGTFPTAAPANPTLTLSALALRYADHMTGAAP